MLTAFRISVLLLGGFAFGLTLFVSIFYISVWQKLRTNGLVPPYHVPVIGLAHMTLIAATMAGIISRIHNQAAFAYYFSPLILIGYIGTIFSLVQVLRSNHVRKIHRAVQENGRR